jgi:UDP-N-acetylglucosamine--N-acetylmuramyl-(pentapeptide) pyrophosphoryl-undecaprenol N-acetylglucosamine transferase
MAESSRTILVAAGGTGGHIFPGLAVADELRRRDAGTRVVFVGTPKGLESKIVPRAGYELTLLPILPLNAVGAARAVKGLLALPWGLLKAALTVRRLRPQAVLGVGGYAGGPLVLAAARSWSAHGDPGAQRAARLHQPQAAPSCARRPAAT